MIIVTSEDGLPKVEELRIMRYEIHKNQDLVFESDTYADQPNLHREGFLNECARYKDKGYTTLLIVEDVMECHVISPWSKQVLTVHVTDQVSFTVAFGEIAAL